MSKQNWNFDNIFTLFGLTSPQAATSSPDRFAGSNAPAMFEIERVPQALESPTTSPAVAPPAPLKDTASPSDESRAPSSNHLDRDPDNPSCCLVEEERKSVSTEEEVGSPALSHNTSALVKQRDPRHVSDEVTSPSSVHSYPSDESLGNTPRQDDSLPGDELPPWSPWPAVTKDTETAISRRSADVLTAPVPTDGPFAAEKSPDPLTTPTRSSIDRLASAVDTCSLQNEETRQEVEVEDQDRSAATENPSPGGQRTEEDETDTARSFETVAAASATHGNQHYIVDFLTTLDSSSEEEEELTQGWEDDSFSHSSVRSAGADGGHGHRLSLAAVEEGAEDGDIDECTSENSSGDGDNDERVDLRTFVGQHDYSRGVFRDTSRHTGLRDMLKVYYKDPSSYDTEELEG